MTNLNQKLKDWLELKNIQYSIKTLKGEQRAYAFEIFVNKGVSYFERYKESYDASRRPERECQ